MFLQILQRQVGQNFTGDAEAARTRIQTTGKRPWSLQRRRLSTILFAKKPDDRGAVVDKLLKGIWRVFLTISPDYSDAIPDFFALS